MQVTLNSIQVEILEMLVENGQYPSLEIALDAALLRLIDEGVVSGSVDDPSYSAWVEETRAKVNAARAQTAVGEVQSVDEVLAELRAKVQRAKESAA